MTKTYNEHETSFFFFAHKHKASATTLLKIAGYKAHPRGRGFIRESEQGRFHAYVHNSKVFEVHFDLTVDGRHFTPNAPRLLTDEKRRIFKRVAHLQAGQLSLGEFEGLLRKWKGTRA